MVKFARGIRAFAVVAIVASAAAMVVAGEGMANTTSSSGGSLAAAKAASAAAYSGRWTTPPTTSNPAAKSKTIWIISPGQTSPPAALLAAGIAEGAKAMGWKSTLCDGKLSASVQIQCWGNAIAAKADGIFGVATDCPNIKAQLQAAKKAGIATVGTFAFDCSEIDPKSPSYFTAKISFGKRYASQPEYFRASGEDAAAWTIAQTNGKTKVISFDDSEYYDLMFWQQGFHRGMKKYCPTCADVIQPYVVGDFGPKLQSVTSAALTRNRSANAVQASWNPQLGVTQGIAAAGKSATMKSIGGLGVAADADVVRQGKLNAVVGQPLKWFGYAAADTMNSIFNKTPVEDAGIGYAIFDKQRNLPAAGKDFESSVPYAALYKKRWGVK